MILFRDDHDDGKRSARRLRKTRRPSWDRDVDWRPDGDFPVFLDNPDQPMLSSVQGDEAHASRHKRFPFLIRAFPASLKTGYIASKEQIKRLRRRGISPPANLANAKFDSETARFALIILLVPLVLLFMFDRSFRAERNTAAPVVAQIQPRFDLDDRLAFAEHLRDQFISRGISSALEDASPPVPENEQPAAETEHESQPEQQSDADRDVATFDPPLETLASTTADERQWRLPFDSETYVPNALPTTAAGSFRAEIDMSHLMGNLMSVVANDVQDHTAAQPAKRAIKKRKKAVAQKRRPQAEGQMTASAAASPTQVPQQPNLPPPPILFFLGAPPPQPAQSPQ